MATVNPTDPDPSLKTYVEEARKELKIFEATYPCPVCHSEDGLMQAAGQWVLGSKKRAEKIRIFQYKCEKCGATLRIAEKEPKGAKQNAEAPNNESEQTSPQTH